MCLSSAPQWMSGIGDVLDPAPALPPCWLVLANPLRETPTRAVFDALTRHDSPPAARPAAPFADARALADWMAEARNDLAPPGPGCLHAGMSGSGATCFGLFAGAEDALAARAALPQGLWRVAAPLGSGERVNPS